MSLVTRDLYLSLEDNKVNTKNHYCVYVIELDKAVLNEKKFVAKNPNLDKSKKCYYIGMTGLSAETRFDRHKNGIKHNIYAQRYGIKLVPDLYKHLINLSFDDAVTKEIELGNKLRSEHHAVWFA